MRLNNEMLCKNPAPFEKHFLEVNTKTREEEIKHHIEFYETTIRTHDLYKDVNMIKDEKAPELIRENIFKYWRVIMELGILKS